MTENLGHYIPKHLRRVFRRRLVPPILYLIILAALWLLLPLYDILFPPVLDRLDNLPDYSNAHSSYVSAKLENLYFTGYTNSSFGRTNGYYYYTLQDKECVIVLLSPRTCEEGLPQISSVQIRGRVLKRDAAYDALLEHLSQDLNWTKEGISQKTSNYFISEPAFRLTSSALLVGLYFATGAYALISTLLCILYICLPTLSPACRQLRRFGKPSALLAQAEEELATLPQLATEDMFITEHFFIVLANYGAAIVPIKEIIWIYKYSTMHKILWHHFSISYTLHITANKHLYIQCPKNMKSDIDGVMDYLSEANHDILVGFNEENRLKVKQKTMRLKCMP